VVVHPEYRSLWEWMDQNLIRNGHTKSTDITAFGKNNSTLFAIVLGKQNYDIFINTTNLNEGYYLLVNKRSHKTYPKGFYLSNNSRT
jgi:hypothetical protein